MAYEAGGESSNHGKRHSTGTGNREFEAGTRWKIQMAGRSVIATRDGHPAKANRINSGEFYDIHLKPFSADINLYM